MPIAVTRYLCRVCKETHRDYSSAVACEALPLQPLEFYEGGTISFENETEMYGGRYSYSSQSGIVLFAFPVTREFNDGRKEHAWFYIVESTYSEVGVMKVQRDGIFNYTSLAEWKFQKGYASKMRHEKTYDW